METLLGLLQSLTAGTSAQRVLFVLGAGATAFMFVLGVSLLFVAATDPVRRRLNHMARQSRARGKLASGILRLIEPVSRYVLPTRSEERGRVQKSLDFAGFRSPNALSLFYAIKTGLALLLL